MKGFPRKESEMQRLKEERDNLRASLNSCKTSFGLLLQDKEMKLSSKRLCESSIKEIQRNLK